MCSKAGGGKPRPVVDRALAVLGQRPTGGAISQAREGGGQQASDTAARPAGSEQVGVETQYLVFQLLTYLLDGSPAFDKAKLNRQVTEILHELGGLQGDGKMRQLGFGVGPLSLDQTDTELREVIQEAVQDCRGAERRRRDSS